MPCAWQECVIEDLAADEPNAMCIGPFGSDLLASDLVEQGVPVVFVRNVRPGRFDGDELRYVTPSKAEKLRSHRVRPGDIVITKMGLPPCIAATYPDGAPDGIVTADIIKMTPNPAKVEARYLVHFLNSPVARAQVARFTFGVTRPKVTLKDFRALRLHLPPLAGQRRIADILDKADAIRRKRREAIALTEELLRSAFLEMFGDPVTNSKGWGVASLGDIAEVAGGLQVTHARERNPIKMPYLRVANVFRDRLDLSEVKNIRVTEAEAERAALHKGDVLVVEGHGNANELGRAAVWSNEIPRTTHQNHLIRVRPGESVEPIFVSAYINSTAGRAQMLRMGKTTSGLNTISTSNVRSVDMLVPPLHNQRLFVQLVSQRTHFLRSLTDALCAADVLFDSLVQRAFRGELAHEATKPQLRLFDRGKQ